MQQNLLHRKTRNDPVFMFLSKHLAEIHTNKEFFMKQILIFAVGAMLSFGAYAADKPATQKPQSGKKTEWTKEQRETMAKNHETMAACLRSDKPVSECHDEMMKHCTDADACPMMMGGKGMHRGMMQGGK
jgi:hypothetical protein